MKVKVVIESGETTIVLTPENNFEESVLSTVHSDPTLHKIVGQVNLFQDPFVSSNKSYSLVVRLIKDPL